MLRRSARALRQHTSNLYRVPGAGVPLSVAVKEHQATGEDAARNTTLDFLELHFRLVPYRVTRLIDEVCELTRNPSHMIPTVDSIPFFVKCVFLFYLGWFMCRGMKFGTFIEPPNDDEPAKHADTQHTEKQTSKH
jgi:hypothetical protein